MRRSLQGKLILSYVAVALLTVLAVSALIWFTSGQALMKFVAEQRTAQVREALQDYYASNGTLDGVFDGLGQYDRRASQAPPDGSSRPPRLRGVSGVVDADNRAMLPMYGHEVGQTVPDEQLAQAIPVQVNGKTIAWVLPDTGIQARLSADEELFLQRNGLVIGMATLAGIAAAVTMGYVLASALLRPIRQLTRASKALAGGTLGQQLAVTSHDELGQLTATFNHMSAALARADDQRKRLTADVAHDLATPLQVISGYIDMLEDGDVTLTPERIDIIRTELGHLRRLVGDLGMLTQVEAGGLEMQLQPIAPEALLRRMGQTFQPIAGRQGVTVALDAAEALPAIQADEGRMMQVLRNLLENALRHTPDGGRITLGARLTGGQVVLSVQDSGEGVDAGDLPFLFDRFYRADKVRSENSGKMGLGLAICKALIHEQGGVISAESDGKGQGTRILMCFDLNAKQGA